MTFYYFMYSSTVESLSVYVRSNGSDRDERIWSRYGNHLSSNWTKGCVAVNISGTYQVETFWAKLCGYFFKAVEKRKKMMLVHVKLLLT